MGRSLRTALAVSAVIAGLALAALVADAPPALGASCPSTTVVTGSRSIDGVKTRVLTATNLSCRNARAIVNTYGLYIAARGAYVKGGRYLLGVFSCTVTSAPRSGPVTARCAEKRRVFTVAYRLGS